MGLANVRRLRDRLAGQLWCSIEMVSWSVLLLGLRKIVGLQGAAKDMLFDVFKAWHIISSQISAARDQLLDFTA